MIDPIHDLLTHLQGVKQAGPDRWDAYCPVHENPPDGHKRSLGVKRGDDGRALVNCRAGCQTARILAALEMSMSDLFPPKRAAPARKIAAACDYRDEEGTLLYQVVRYRPKGFRQRRPDGNGGWVWNLDGIRRILYRLPELLAADRSEWVFIAEGEKDVDNLRALGLVATTNPGGAGKWRDDYSETLCDRRVAILYDKDNDKCGRRHAEQVAMSLHGKAADVRIVELPGDGKDVSNWIEAHNAQTAEELRARLTSLADAAPPFDPAPHVGGPVLVRVSDVEPEKVSWLWQERIPLGRLTLIAGDPGLGKSFVTLDMAARVTHGMPWPDTPAAPSTAGSVVLLSAEDDVADTIRPRLDAAGADVSKITVLEAVKFPDPGSRQMLSRPFSLGRDLLALEEAITRTGNVRLVVIDPLTAYLGRADSHKNADIRGLLAPLAALAARHKVAVVAVTHLNKSASGSALYRTMGSLAFVAAARAVWAVVKDKGNPARRLVLPVKNNLARDAAGLAYAIVNSPVAPGIGVVAWEADAVTVSVDEALAFESPIADEKPASEEASAWLQEVLADGPVGTKELQRMARECGQAWRTVRRAKDRLGVVVKRSGFGPGATWSWALPDHRWPQDPIDVQPQDVDPYVERGRLCENDIANNGAGQCIDGAWPLRAEELIQPVPDSDRQQDLRDSFLEREAIAAVDGNLSDEEAGRFAFSLLQAETDAAAGRGSESA